MTLAGLADGRYYTEAVQWSVDWGVAGIDGNCFRPDEPVSRGEAAVYIWNTSNPLQTQLPDSALGTKSVDATLQIAGRFEIGVGVVVAQATLVVLPRLDHCRIVSPGPVGLLSGSRFGTIGHAHGHSLDAYSTDANGTLPRQRW